jgi:glycogen operon protein
VNYVTSHDGATLYDLVAYNEKRNQANGHGNTDGHDEYRWNCGWEGDEGVPAEVLALRKRQVKNFLALLLLSNGTPMLRMGDEFLRTQGGNNNPYNQDNETTWLDWRRREEHADVFAFAKGMIAFRRAHPTIGRSHFWREDVRWYGTTGPVDLSAGSRTLAYFLAGGEVHDRDLYVMVNAHSEPLPYRIREPGPWRRVVDTSLPSPEDVLDPDGGTPVTGDAYTVAGRSVVVLVR